MRLNNENRIRSQTDRLERSQISIIVFFFLILILSALLRVYCTYRTYNSTIISEIRDHQSSSNTNDTITTMSDLEFNTLPKIFHEARLDSATDFIKEINPRGDRCLTTRSDDGKNTNESEDRAHSTLKAEISDEKRIDAFVKEIGEDPLCSICLNDLGQVLDLVILPQCNHIYHEECIKQWLTQKESTCPLCKSIVRPISVE